MQRAKFPFCLYERGKVGVGIFPEGEKILVGQASLGGIVLCGVAAREAQAGERAKRVIQDHARIVD